MRSVSINTNFSFFSFTFQNNDAIWQKTDFLHDLYISFKFCHFVCLLDIVTTCKYFSFINSEYRKGKVLYG